MQIFKRMENKRLAVSMNDGKEMSVESLTEIKNALLDRICRETDAKTKEDLEMQLTQINSAIGALKNAERSLALTRLEVESKRAIYEAEIAAAAELDRTNFESNIQLITNKRLETEYLERDHDPMGDDQIYGRMVKAYFDQLFKSLTLDQAQAQVNEIFLAVREGNRPWKHVVALPTPKAIDYSISVFKGAN